MAQTEVKDLLNAGVHFGHLTRKWNPNMAPYIYMERNGIHIINLYKTAAKIEEAQSALKKIAISGRKILFVATKKQAKDIVAEKVKNINMPYITERWPGGMLTNFVTIRKAVKKMAAVDRMKSDGTFETLSKKEKLQVSRMRAKLEKNLGSITDMTRLPGALFVVDIKRENIAIKEAQKLNIPIFAMVDTNSDPREVDFVIPSNDDASKSIEKILNLVTLSISEGLSQRKNEKDALEKGEGQSSPPVSKTEPEVESASEKQEATAEKIEDVPEEVKVAPKKVKASPEEANATPEKANATPEKVEALPKVKTVKKKATKKKTISKPKKINSKEKK
jgi:small subunit ribosomal protein S2